MKNLFKRLSTFAGDYSGACLAARDMKCLIVLHGQGGCIGGVCTCDDIEQQTGDMNIVFTKISEVDTVIGNDEVMINRVESAVDALPFDFILICGSPIPMLIGTDFKSWIRRLEAETNKPVIALDTKGFARYDEGESMLFEALIDKFGTKTSSTKNKVNVIGDTALNGWTAEMREDYRKSLAKEFDEVVFWGKDIDLSGLRTMAEAKLNIVASVSALEAAKKIKTIFGTPYMIAETVGGSGVGGQHTKGDRAFVVCEQVMGNAIRKCLINNFGFGDVTVGTFFEMSDEIKDASDIAFDGEDDYEKFVKANGPFDYVVGDRELELFGGYTAGFIEYPHLAISGRLITESMPDVFGQNGYDFFKERLEEQG